MCREEEGNPTAYSVIKVNNLYGKIVILSVRQSKRERENCGKLGCCANQY